MRLTADTHQSYEGQKAMGWHIQTTKVKKKKLNELEGNSMSNCMPRKLDNLDEIDKFLEIHKLPKIPTIAFKPFMFLSYLTASSIIIPL